MSKPASQQSLCEQLARVEAKVDQLTTLMAKSESPHTASVGGTPPLLVGWEEIVRVLRKGPRTLRRYRQGQGLPVFRWGRHVVSTLPLVEQWLVQRETNKLRSQGGSSAYTRLFKMRGWNGLA